MLDHGSEAHPRPGNENVKDRSFLNLPSMQLKRMFISVTLLLTYAVGSVHALVPHCHHAESGVQLSADHHRQHHHRHQHHEHDDDPSGEHHHVMHRDHLDDGLMDLLICILSETAHSGASVDQCLLNSKVLNKLPTDAWSKVKLTAVPVTIAGIDDKVLDPAPACRSVPPGLHGTAHNASSPHRGPPLVS